NAHHLAIGTWTHLERLALREMFVTWPLALRLIRNVLRSERCPSLGHWHLDSSSTSCTPRDVRHLAIGAWTHPARLPLLEMFVTWPLALGLIQNVLRSRRCSSLGHWRLDSSRMSCALGDVRHLAIGAWTNLERLALQEMFVTWPLALGFIRGNEYMPG
ncbi:hypothetical protein Tco_0160838, partial [Tanacetum coccineum]